MLRSRALSESAIGRIIQGLKAELETWQTRPVADLELVAPRLTQFSRTWAASYQSTRLMTPVALSRLGWRDWKFDFEFRPHRSSVNWDACRATTET